MARGDSPTNGTALLATRGLTKRFGGVIAVNRIDFDLRPGELRCLIGPNGAGKSTFFKMISGQLYPSEGTIFFEGRAIAGLERHEIARAGVGVKTQVPSVFNGLTVRENLRVSARRSGASKTIERDLDELVARFGFGEIEHIALGRLAHGQRQWVELAMVVATAPRLMLLDEPVAGMSEEETERTAELIGELSREAAMIVVDHDIRFIRMIASTVTVFHRGEVLVDGSVDAVLADERVRDVYLGRQAFPNA